MQAKDRHDPLAVAQVATVPAVVTDFDNRQPCQAGGLAPLCLAGLRHGCRFIVVCGED